LVKHAGVHSQYLGQHHFQLFFALKACGGITWSLWTLLLLTFLSKRHSFVRINSTCSLHAACLPRPHCLHHMEARGRFEDVACPPLFLIRFDIRLLLFPLFVFCFVRNESPHVADFQFPGPLGKKKPLPPGVFSKKAVMCLIIRRLIHVGWPVFVPHKFRDQSSLRT